MKQLNWSFYKILSVIITLSVVVFVVFRSYVFYSETENRMIDSLKLDSSLMMESLQKSLGYLMESYSINEYEKLIASKMGKKDFYAIVVEDYNMSKILGTKTYQTGSYRDQAWQINELSNLQTPIDELLNSCFHKQTGQIYSQGGAPIGHITICSTDSFINQELRALLLRSVIEAIIFASLMILLLIFTIRNLLLQPVSNIISNLKNADEDGLPKNKLHKEGATEIVELSDDINQMVDTIRASKTELNQKNLELENEKTRFELAVEGTNNGLWDWDVPSGRAYHSRRFETMLGYSGDELPDTVDAWMSLIHPEDLKQAMKSVEEYFESQGQITYQSTFRMKTKQGEWRWINGLGKASFDKEGKPTRFVGFNADVTEAFKHQEQLDFIAKHDHLTSLPNRYLLNELIEKSMAHVIRNNQYLALLFIDLDGFKRVNDQYGHHAGDQLLIEVAQKISKIIREEDISARIGGDEFVIGLTDLATKESIYPVLNRLLTDLEGGFTDPKGGKRKIFFSASIGVSFYPQETPIGFDSLLRQADQAMYEAKASGKNRFEVFSLDKDYQMKKHFETIDKFKTALQEDQLTLHYQPRVNMCTGKVLGLEALIRWESPDGIIYPDEFLPFVTHEKELMLELGKHVFRQAFHQLSEWLEAGLDIMVSINVSSYEIKERNIELLLEKLLKRYPNISPKNIELEILESTAFDDFLHAQQVIKQIQALGIKVSLDDFGTGFSTLSYMKSFPVDIIKIDKSFVLDMESNPASASIIKASLGLAQAFNCETVAEGVESIRHGELLLELGCDIAQGYAISKAMPADQVLDWVENYQGFVEWQNYNP